MKAYEHHPHHHILERRARGPVTVRAQYRLDHPNPIVRFNAHAALLVTRGVGTMWCAYAFGLFDLLSLPAAIRGGTPTLVSWVAQTFLQLVLLSVIMVGQSVQAKAADKRADATYNDAEMVLHECLELQRHLAAQDEVLTQLIAREASGQGKPQPGNQHRIAGDSGEPDTTVVDRPDPERPIPRRRGGAPSG